MHVASLLRRLSEIAGAFAAAANQPCVITVSCVLPDRRLEGLSTLNAFYRSRQRVVRNLNALKAGFCPPRGHELSTA